MYCINTAFRLTTNQIIKKQPTQYHLAIVGRNYSVEQRKVVILQYTENFSDGKKMKISLEKF